MYNEQLRYLNSSRNIINMIKSRMMRCVRQIVHRTNAFINFGW